MIDKLIEWIVIVVVSYATTLAILLAGLSILEMSFYITVINFIIVTFLFVLLIYQKRHFGFRILNRFYFFFFLLYYLYALLDMTAFRLYPLEIMASVPETIAAFFIRSFILLCFVLCSDTIVQCFNLNKYLLFSLLVGTLPSIAYVNYVGFETFQTVGVEVDSDDFISPLGIAYINASIVVLSFFNIKTLFNSKILSYIVSWFIIIIGIYIIVAVAKRGAILWSAVNIMICSFYISKKSSKYIAFALVAMFLAYLNLDYIIDSISNVAPKTAELFELTIKEGYTASRFDLEDAEHSTYLIGISNFLEAPFFGNYFRLVTDYDLYMGGYPHNIFIEILMTMGLFGFIPFFILLMRSLVRCFYYFRSSYTNNDLAFLIMFLAVFLQLQTTGTLLFKYDFWLFFYILCCICEIGRTASELPQQSKEKCLQ